MSDKHDSPHDDGALLAVLGRLQAACASDTTASVMAAHMALPSAGRLQSASMQGVVIEIPNPPTTELTMLGYTASVSFSVGPKVAGFVTEVTALRTAPDGALLATMALPQRLDIRERRSAVRIPVPEASLHAALLGPNTARQVRPIDISLTGILIEVTEAQTAHVVIGQSVTLRLTPADADKGDVVQVSATVCRQDHLRFGLQYETDGRPPKGLTRMIYEIQQPRRPSR